MHFKGKRNISTASSNLEKRSLAFLHFLVFFTFVNLKTLQSLFFPDLDLSSSVSQSFPICHPRPPHDFLFTNEYSIRYQISQMI
ncbi:hypothetical protein L596_008108 [Steinernema carpocapsae]|uniref:Uncharacterized protein n=1 Tax=Steinernema carpocapsae TaxID=34508 RepID=A0A4U5PBJ2_STECR|nr:hypothetical protein L596_008108 [Steinernema carpocapsae]